jgi:hypothetical protein
MLSQPNTFFPLPVRHRHNPPPSTPQQPPLQCCRPVRPPTTARRCYKMCWPVYLHTLSKHPVHELQTRERGTRTRGAECEHEGPSVREGALASEGKSQRESWVVRGEEEVKEKRMAWVEGRGAQGRPSTLSESAPRGQTPPNDPKKGIRRTTTQAAVCASCEPSCSVHKILAVQLLFTQSISPGIYLPHTPMTIFLCWITVQSRLQSNIFCGL